MSAVEISAAVFPLAEERGVLGMMLLGRDDPSTAATLCGERAVRSTRDGERSG